MADLPRAFVYTVEIDGEWWTVTTSGPFRDEDQARAFSDWVQSEEGNDIKPDGVRIH
ncbi:MAG: hypothetical protein RIB59_12645 [Rhodospirillales bacterium]